MQIAGPAFVVSWMFMWFWYVRHQDVTLCLSDGMYTWWVGSHGALRKSCFQAPRSLGASTCSGKHGSMWGPLLALLCSQWIIMLSTSL